MTDDNTKVVNLFIFFYIKKIIEKNHYVVTNMLFLSKRFSSMYTGRRLVFGTNLLHVGIYELTLPLPFHHAFMSNVGVSIYPMSMRLRLNFTSSLNNPNSEEYRSLSQGITSSVSAVVIYQTRQI